MLRVLIRSTKKEKKNGNKKYECLFATIFMDITLRMNKKYPEKKYCLKKESCQAKVLPDVTCWGKRVYSFHFSASSFVCTYLCLFVL